MCDQVMKRRLDHVAMLDLEILLVMKWLKCHGDLWDYVGKKIILPTLECQYLEFPKEAKVEMHLVSALKVVTMIALGQRVTPDLRN